MEKYLEEHYDEIYEEYCNRHPEEITSDFMLEEDGNQDYINEIISDLKDKEISRLNNIIKDIKDYVNFLVIINQTINGKFSETQWGQDILGLIGDDNE